MGGWGGGAARGMVVGRLIVTTLTTSPSSAIVIPLVPVENKMKISQHYKHIENMFQMLQ